MIVAAPGSTVSGFPTTFGRWLDVGVADRHAEPVLEYCEREGIGLIPLFLNISRGTEDEFETMMPHYEKLVAVLAEQKCDLIHPNGAPPFMVHGFKGEAKIVAVDLLDSKLEFAREFGATHTVNPSRDDAVEGVKAATNGGTPGSPTPAGGALLSTMCTLVW